MLWLAIIESRQRERRNRRRNLLTGIKDKCFQYIIDINRRRSAASSAESQRPKLRSSQPQEGMGKMTKYSRLSNHQSILTAALGIALSACTFSSEAAPTLQKHALKVLPFEVVVDPYEGLYASKGAAYRTAVSHSFYFSAIVQNGQPRGNSRIWGDAPIATQRAAISAILYAANKANMSKEQTAVVLAIAYVESGFNPDAAAGTTSAHGLGQFIRKTGEAYGLTDANRWDVEAQARALVAHTCDNLVEVERRGLGLEYVYARHHDGSFENKYGGLDLARTRVMPLARKFLEQMH
jgi:hypothetical protein